MYDAQVEGPTDGAPPSVYTPEKDPSTLDVYVEASVLEDAEQLQEIEGDYWDTFGSLWFEKSPSDEGFEQWLFTRSTDAFGFGDAAFQEDMCVSDRKAFGSSGFKARMKAANYLDYIGRG